MRDTIFKALIARMERDPSVFFLTADVGINLVEPIRDRFPRRYLNVGIAEQNLIGVACGLANAGYRPVVYTISNFVTERCFEQLRDDAALHDYPLVLLGLGAGFDNAQLGPTHHIVSDWGVVRNLPGWEVHCPSSVAYARRVLDDVLDRKAPAYIRIPKGNGWEYPFGADGFGAWHAHAAAGSRQPHTLLVTYGGQVPSCLAAKEERPLDLALLVLNQLRPLPERLLGPITARRRVVVVEDHFAETGLYASVCQALAANSGVSVYSRAPGRYYREAGDSPEFFWRKYRGDAASLVQDFS